jgi:hypothetical protein
MHVCRESRNEYLYRENDAANNVEGKGPPQLVCANFPKRERKVELLFIRGGYVVFDDFQ